MHQNSRMSMSIQKQINFRNNDMATIKITESQYNRLFRPEQNNIIINTNGDVVGLMQ